jgi:hypothetical protein
VHYEKIPRIACHVLKKGGIWPFEDMPCFGLVTPARYRVSYPLGPNLSRAKEIFLYKVHKFQKVIATHEDAVNRGLSSQMLSSIFRMVDLSDRKSATLRQAFKASHHGMDVSEIPCSRLSFVSLPWAGSFSSSRVPIPFGAQSFSL